MRLKDIYYWGLGRHWGRSLGGALLLGSAFSLSLLGGACSPKDRVSITNDSGISSAGAAGVGNSPGAGGAAGNAAGVGNTAGVGAGSGSSGSAGIGTEKECNIDADCPGSAIDCAGPRCNNGKCVLFLVPVGNLVTDGLDGNCTSQVCSGTGLVADNAELDIRDAPVSSNQCVTLICNDDKTTSEQNNPNNTPCGVNGETSGSLCSDGVCNACLYQTGVAKCQSGCSVCAAGAACFDNGGCISKNCAGITSGSNTTGVCAAASCSDSILNGTESDVDCGGSSGCGGCADDRSCRVNSDCMNGSTCILRSGGKSKQCSSTGAPKEFWDSFSFDKASMESGSGKFKFEFSGEGAFEANSPWNNSADITTSCLRLEVSEFTREQKQLSLSFWYRPISELNGRLLLSLADFGVWVSERQGLYLGSFSSKFEIRSEELPLALDKWNHILLNIDYEKLAATIAVNAQAQSIQLSDSAILAKAGLLQLNCDAAGENYTKTFGRIDELYLYQRLLGSDEVTNYYLANSALLP